MTSLPPSALGYNFADLMVVALALAICSALAILKRGRTEGLLLLTTATIGLLFLIRIGLRISQEPTLLVLEGLAVGSLALLTLLTAESLSRFHAPLFVKVAVGAAAMGILLVAIAGVATGTSLAGPASGVLFVASLGLVAAFVLTRPRHALFAGENARLTSLGVALALAIPLAASDFILTYYDSAVGLGAIGVLLMLLTLTRIVARRNSLGGLAFDIAAALLVSTLLAYMVDRIGNPTPAERRAIFVGIAAVSLGMISAGHLRQQLSHHASLPITIFLARARRDSHEAFLTDLAPHHLLNGARLLSSGETKELIEPSVMAEIKARKVLSRALLERRADRGVASFAEEAALSVLKSEGAAHLILISRDPARVLIAGSSSLGTNDEDISSLLVLSDIATITEWKLKNDRHRRG